MNQQDPNQPRTPEEIEVARRNLLAQLRHDLAETFDVVMLDRGTAQDLVEVLKGLAPKEES